MISDGLQCDGYAIVHGDNAVELPRIHQELLAKWAPSLVYMDPPFRTGKTQTGPAGEFDDPALPMPEFVRGVVDVFEKCWRMLPKQGCIVVHLDQKAHHYVKVAIDELVGADKFASEIIWSYRRWPSKTRNFQRTHDTLLRYVRDSESATWNQIYQPPSVSTLATWGTKKQRAKVVDGVRVRSTVGAEESPGVPMGDVWDIGIIAPVAKERTGWPTQKPEALLERLILATTDPGDLVLDPFMGSATSLAVAVKLGRYAIGIDRNPQAIAVARARLSALAQSPARHPTGQ